MSFNFFKSGPPMPEGYFPIGTDIHSHILPGIDDGSPDVASSLELVHGLQQLGFTRSVATPHVISDLYRNTPATIDSALQQLQAALQAEGNDFSVSAAAEYMLDDSFFELLDKGERLLTIHDNMLLTEFSFGYRPDNPKEMSFAIITGGYTPILAHPERYAYFHDNYKAYHLLQELGFKLQVNLLSLTGYYGAPVAKAARYILKKELASFVGTDMHHANHLAALQDPANHKIFWECLGEREWNVLF